MPLQPNFPHLPLIVFEGRHRARLPRGGGAPDPRIAANRADRPGHANRIRRRLAMIRQDWLATQEQRRLAGLPVIGDRTVFVLQLPVEHDLTFLMKAFGLELVAEYEDGFVLAGAPNLDFAELERALRHFENEERGGASCAKLLDVFGPFNPNRLNLVLSPTLRQAWPFTDAETRILDVWVEVPGHPGFMRKPRSARRRNEARDEYRQRRDELLATTRERQERAWDEAKEVRIEQLQTFITGNGGEIVGQLEDPAEEHDGIVFFPDSVLVRVRMSGRGFRDIVENFPYLVRLCEPDEADGPVGGVALPAEVATYNLVPPPPDAPAVCVVDSGIQEAHRWLSTAVDADSSRCYLPGRASTDVADECAPVGHGTSVAGAVLYPGAVPREGQVQAVAWVQNARVLDDTGHFTHQQNNLLDLQRIIDRYRHGDRATRLFVHSINDTRPCHLRRMTPWAALLDALSHEHDVLFLQSAGNLCRGHGNESNPGVAAHLAANRPYPTFLLEPSSRIASPAQSLQALTVGSVSSAAWRDSARRSFAPEAYSPSAFSRCGLGIWDSVKPDVVEVGGDFAYDDGGRVLPCPATAPELVQSTLHGATAVGRHQVGTSFAAPKVAHIAAQLQALFPDATALLYRALIINSARWPAWAEGVPEADRLAILRQLGYGVPDLVRATENSTCRVTLLTAGLQEMRNQEARIYCVPVPPALRDPAARSRVRIDVTLCYTSLPRPTRSTKNGYLETWLSWKASHLEEPIDSFVRRTTVTPDRAGDYPGLPWMLHEREDFGGIDGANRHNGTAQKDWTVVDNTRLPDRFAVAVQAHKGWNQEEAGGSARFVLVVSFEALDRDIEVYAHVRNAVELEVPLRAQVNVMRRGG